MRVRPTQAVPAVIIVALALSGCGAADPGATTPGAKPSSAAASGAAKKPAAAKPKATTANFHNSVTYKDGLKVQVIKIRQITAGQYAAGAKPGARVTALTIRVNNGSSKAFDVSLVSPSVTYGKDGVKAPDVFDGSKFGGMTGKVLPGKAQTATWGFGIPKADLGDVTLQVGLGSFTHDAAIFTGSVK
jgi:hypothetical protein